VIPGYRLAGVRAEITDPLTRTRTVAVARRGRLEQLGEISYGWDRAGRAGVWQAAGERLADFDAEPAARLAVTAQLLGRPHKIVFTLIEAAEAGRGFS